ncbi:MAG: hypothetical protein ACFE9C_04735 [Candidatus Hodarchaeota archaeon]
MVKAYEYDDEMEDYEQFGKDFYNKADIVNEKKDKRDYLNIWDANPSFKDIVNNQVIPQTIFLLGITLGIIITMYVFTSYLPLSIGVGIIFCLGLILIFHDEIYLLRYFFQFFSRSKAEFTPFEDMVFWYKEHDTATLFISNRKDLVHVALRVYQIKIIAENIHPSVYQFVKALASKNVCMSYSYQIVQKPVILLFNNGKSQREWVESLQSRAASIYFSVFTQERGILTTHKLDKMLNKMAQYSSTLKSAIVSNFHHFQALLLTGNALLNAVRTFYLKEKVATYKNPIDKRRALGSTNSHTSLKFGICVGLIVYVSAFLIFMKLFIFYIIVINLAFITAFILLWWRSLLFQFTRSKLISEQDIILAEPFSNIRFYRVKEYPYSIFFHIENRLLIGMKLANLKYVYQRNFCHLEKFIESLNNQQVHFSYTLKNQPLNFYDFYKTFKGFRSLNEREQKRIVSFYNTRITRGTEEERWLMVRAGMWLSTLTMSVNSYKFVDSLTDIVFEEVEEDLLHQINSLENAFNVNAQALNIEVMRTSTLISGYLFSVLKNNLYRLNGSHLNYLMMQGAHVMPFTEIVDVLKKATHIEIAAEFNTPLYLENYIIIGKTFNTEVLETEIPFGFTRVQLYNLLIMNGTFENRELLSMKIVSELIKAKLPSIVFDFDGKWSKLLSYFDGTEFKKDILYFKYGSSFIVDPIKSDLPYDQANTEYLEYIYDAFGLALKKDERIVEMFRQTIQKNSNMDLGAIQMELQNQTEWEKSPVNDLLLSVFADFTPNEMTYFQAIQGNSIIASAFVQDKKTILVDLSVFREVKKKLFVTLVILSKIIHYTQHHDIYYKKFLVIPYIDNLFESYFLDMKRSYDKIDIFLKPLVEKKFGLIVSAHQIHYLHSNALLYLNNFITLQATYARDIAVLKNIMNLQELEGMGIYSAKRKHSHQINYLKNLKPDTVIVRREDIDQPFPAIIDIEKIQKSPTLRYEEIVKFMDSQGFDLHTSERRILEQARETVFEIDLGHYFVYIEEIIKFMNHILSIDQIGNLYKDKLKTHLKEFLYPKITEKTQNKQHIKKIIENVLDTLIKHHYLVENHPRRAGGGEALRTSFSVGPRYNEALEDYYKVKGKANREFQVEVLEKESNAHKDLQNIFPTQPRRYVIQEKNLKEALSREIGNLYYELFKMYGFINNRDYSSALKIKYGLIKNYLRGVYRHYYNTDAFVLEGFNSFLTLLAKTKGFPFSKQELNDMIDHIPLVGIEDEESLVKENYQSISIFFRKLQNFINEEEDKL